MNIKQIPSPHFTPGRKTYRPEAIVIHIMEGTLTGTDSWFKNPQSKVSAHYGIGKNGEVHQYVQEHDTAWHAGRVNAPKWTLIKAAGNGMYINPNSYTIGLEHEGNENTDWTPAMFEASCQLVADIAGRWNIPIDRQHVIGHHEIYSLKTCPGFKVDLNKLVQQAQANAGQINGSDFVAQAGTTVTTTWLNIRNGATSSVTRIRTASPGEALSYTGYTDKGETVKGVSRWYRTMEGYWFWGGGVRA